MKKCRLLLSWAIIAAALVTQVLSCSKHQTSSDNACIQRIIPDRGQPRLPVAQIDAIDSLFINNNISTAHLQFNTYIPNTNTDPAVVPQELVVANIFINGLPLFNYDDVFTFNAGILDSALLYPGTPSTNDATGHQTLSFLRTAFLKYAVASSPDQYANICLSATLGYIDASWLPGNVLSWGTPIKAWKITPSNSDFPLVFVKDDDSTGWAPPALSL